eukprot:CAMPEP_0197391676 /NCGR_PEP_ID=MMETSP1165-20131217/3255_1 /TAXON_ID=284809 /ORGANISM="Chrysocystis fragilis, Strain CCMP3189" /LENGTH=69 /DNA_ID=CAMNT_0042917269 /DNA_START=45 /DNA_END=254 /DNA_ORIENTATION=+
MKNPRECTCLPPSSAKGRRHHTRPLLYPIGDRWKLDPQLACKTTVGDNVTMLPGCSEDRRVGYKGSEHK